MAESAWWQIVVDCRDRGASERELLIDDLWARGSIGIHEDADQLVAAFDNAPAALDSARALGHRARVDAVTDDSYLDAWRPFARPIVVGRLCVRPRWVPSAVPAGLIELAIDPRRTFGGGGHPSTILALELLQRVELAGRTVLDLGSGSGVLAVAAARLGAAFVAAVDIDPHAAPTAAENAAANHVDDRVHLLAGPIDATRGGFDVVVTNVLPSVHAVVASEVLGRAGRYVIASGMLDADAPAVEARYACPVKERRTRDGWSALLMRIDRPHLAP